VVHSAAWTDTAGCERDPEQAILVNATGAGNVAEACASVGASMFYVSSNEVFDGMASEAYREDAATAPLNSYGLSKLAGERAVAMALPAHCIVRTSWLYGPGRVSFPEKVINAARDTGSLKMVTDETAGPTYTIDLARGIAELVRRGARGIFHLANAGGCSRLEWALAILEITGMTDVRVEAVTQADFDAPYRKPVFSTLANIRGAEMGVTLRPWREALAEHLLEPARASGATNSLQ
jgi:dTDP-4-dehydrorhamnose reductase